MDYRRDKIDNIFLYDTRVENIFINEYMTAAPGEYVKVYFLGLMYADSNLPVENHIIASQLNMTEKEVKQAWQYWTEKGIVKTKSSKEKGEGTLQFVNIREKLFGFGTEEESFEEKEDIQNIYKTIEEKWKRMLSGKELEEIGSWPDFYQVEPDLIAKAVEYCAEKEKTTVRYLERVIQGWHENGCKTANDAQKFLEETDQRHFCYRRVFKALGFNRNSTEAERAMMDSWFDELNFAMDKILEACGTTCGIGNPNLKYVDKVLRNWKDDTTRKGSGAASGTAVSRSTLNNYYNYLRDEAQRQSKERLEEVYRLLPRVKDIDGEVSRIGAKMTSALLGGKTEDKKSLDSDMDKLMAERAILLTENNFEMDYTDVKYRCDICKDTGLTDEGERCQCIKDRMEEAEVWQRKN